MARSSAMLFLTKSRLTPFVLSASRNWASPPARAYWASRAFLTSSPRGRLLGLDGGGVEELAARRAGRPGRSMMALMRWASWLLSPWACGPMVSRNHWRTSPAVTSKVFAVTTTRFFSGSRAGTDGGEVLGQLVGRRARGHLHRRLLLGAAGGGRESRREDQNQAFFMFVSLDRERASTKPHPGREFKGNLPPADGAGPHFSRWIVLPVIDGDLGAARAGPEELEDLEEGLVAALPRPVELAGVVGDAHAEPLAGHDLPGRLLQGIELLVAEELGLLQVREGEPGGLEDDVVGVVERPVAEAQAVLGLHPVVELRAGQGRQDEELGRGQPGLLGEAEGLLDRLPVVLVEAEDEHAVDVDPMPAQDPDGLDEVGHGLLLLHGVEANRG